jgi:hypothetical protein
LSLAVAVAVLMLQVAAAQEVCSITEVRTLKRQMARRLHSHKKLSQW